MIIADNGIIIRVRASEISKIGRNTQGVRVMKMKDENAKVVAFTVVPHQDEEEEVAEGAENAEVAENTEGAAESAVQGENQPQE